MPINIDCDWCFNNGELLTTRICETIIVNKHSEGYHKVSILLLWPYHCSWLWRRWTWENFQTNIGTEQQMRPRSWLTWSIAILYTMSTRISGSFSLNLLTSADTRQTYTYIYMTFFFRDTCTQCAIKPLQGKHDDCDVLPDFEAKGLRFNPRQQTLVQLSRRWLHQLPPRLSDETC